MHFPVSPPSCTSRVLVLVASLIVCGVVLLAASTQQHTSDARYNNSTSSTASGKSTIPNTQASGITRRVSSDQMPTNEWTMMLYEPFTNTETGVIQGGQDDYTRSTIEQGSYALHVFSRGLLTWSLVDGLYTSKTNLAIEVETTTDQPGIASGIIFRYQDDDNFYLFNVATNGLYNLELIEHGTWTPLLEWTPSRAIAQVQQAGLPTTNVLRVELVHNTITLFVNGTRLETTIDDTWNRGKIALAVNTFDQHTTTIYFDNLALFWSGE